MDLLERIKKLQQAKFKNKIPAQGTGGSSKSVKQFGGFLWFHEEMDRLGLWGGMDSKWKDRELER